MGIAGMEDVTKTIEITKTVELVFPLLSSEEMGTLLEAKEAESVLLVLAEFESGNGERLELCESQDATYFIYYTDALGSTRLLKDTKVKIEAFRVYDLLKAEKKIIQ